MGILKWVDYTVSDKSYFKLNTDHTPLHLVLLDEVRYMHSLFGAPTRFTLNILVILPHRHDTNQVSIRAHAQIIPAYIVSHIF